MHSRNYKTLILIKIIRNFNDSEGVSKNKKVTFFNVSNALKLLPEESKDYLNK